MEAIDIARKLAGLGSAEEAREAYQLVVHQSGDPAERLEAAVYILQSGGDYKISYTCFRDLYNQGCFQEQILPLMIGAFYEPNVKELQKRYERNSGRSFLLLMSCPSGFSPTTTTGTFPFTRTSGGSGTMSTSKIPSSAGTFSRIWKSPFWRTTFTASMSWNI